MCGCSALTRRSSMSGVSSESSRRSSGPICLQAEEPIAPDDDYGTLAARLQQLGGDLLVRAFDERAPFRDQPDEGVTIAPKIGPEDRRLDPGLEAAFAERRVRALTPHVGAFVELPGGERLGVRRAAVSDRPPPPPSEFSVDEGHLLYGCVAGALELLVVQPAGGRPMEAAAFLRGHGGAIERQQ